MIWQSLFELQCSVWYLCDMTIFDWATVISVVFVWHDNLCFGYSDVCDIRVKWWSLFQLQWTVWYLCDITIFVSATVMCVISVWHDSLCFSYSDLCDMTIFVSATVICVISVWHGNLHCLRIWDWNSSWNKKSFVRILLGSLPLVSFMSSAWLEFKKFGNEGRSFCCLKSGQFSIQLL